MFEDITIKGMDDKRTKRTHEGSETYDVCFVLSAKVTDEWINTFNHQHSSVMYIGYRHVYVSSNTLVVSCPLDDVEFQLATIKPEIVQTNSLYRHFLSEQAKEDQRKQEAILKERKEIEDVAKRLKFD